MAQYGLQYGDQDRGKFSLERPENYIVDAYWRPSASRVEMARRSGQIVLGHALMLRLDIARRVTKIFPLYTMPDNAKFLDPKYGQIKSIELVVGDEKFSPDYSFDTVDDVEAYIAEGLPKGLLTDPNFGLGFDRRLKFFTDNISKLEGVNNVRLLYREDYEEVSLSDEGKTYEISYQLFDELRRAGGRSDAAAQEQSRRRKTQIGYTNLLTRLDPKKFPLTPLDRKPDDIANAIGPAMIDVKLSNKDRSSIIRLAKETVRKSLRSEGSGLAKLHEEIELASLDQLIKIIDTNISKCLPESHWQQQFTLNPFILDMTFGAPMVVVQGQAHVGGKLLDGSGEKIADFLMRNRMTDSVALVEIKTPQTELLSKKEYRGGVYGPSSELAATVIQNLDQIGKFSEEIHLTRSKNGMYDLRGHGIKGVIVAGVMPDAPKRRSLELYRSSLHGVWIITFDELLVKLKSLRDLLSGALA
ncbi:Shedu immune nuclease family protein [Cereibacter johrii]|uniref:Uncharacterized protein DUF4263 n=1 Tax=Cereibacter johrii TaxID=445629 RepID=A0ABX5JHJ6_9RHOB|nr:Shedu immune nuclease family protein [Cereibacter johrii]PTM81869.1 uncharacterized protein DUF4263 [Cereibacter johrii]